ncbi:tryptophan--tRNA ligase [Candidatus Parcubacteria bacterium]|nr:tryptophan--tRNA ligase [Candidatus Parcubacteria bacterium]
MVNKTDKPKIFSGVQPSGNLHIGNYLGAIRQFVALQDEYDCVFCVVDLHAITVPQEPESLRKRIIEVARLFLAAGIDPDKSIIFQQSEVSAHAELSWIFNTVARMSDLRKMTQFKDKSEGEVENVSVGLFDYPVLMAADILLYDTEVVPVGDDQLQHVELARELAKRFNHQHKETFIVPKAKILKSGARIMALDDPTKKMSKSAESANSRIELLDSPEKAAKKIMRATTDSDSTVKLDYKNKPGISNLLTMHHLLSGKEIKVLEKEFAGKGYGDFKKAVAEEVKLFLTAFQTKYNKIDDNDVRKILDDGAKRAQPIAKKTLQKVKERIGLN